MGVIHLDGMDHVAEAPCGLRELPVARSAVLIHVALQEEKIEGDSFWVPTLQIAQQSGVDVARPGEPAKLVLRHPFHCAVVDLDKDDIAAGLGRIRNTAEFQIVDFPLHRPEQRGCVQQQRQA